jgi:hypothetical protein
MTMSAYDGCHMGGAFVRKLAFTVVLNIIFVCVHKAPPSWCLEHAEYLLANPFVSVHAISMRISSTYPNKFGVGPTLLLALCTWFAVVVLPLN